MHRIPAGATSYLIDAGSGHTMREDVVFIRESYAAGGVLRQWVGDYRAMRVLRLLLGEVRHADVNHLNDVEVVDTLSALVAADQVWLATPRPLINTPARFSTDAAPAPTPTPRAATSSPRSAPSDAAAPSFSADVDAALLAATLKGASQDGVPFCEECARAARAA